MSLTLLLEAMKNANVNGLRLFIRDRTRAREYLAQSVRRYYELMDIGLQPSDPVQFLRDQGWADLELQDRAQLPVTLRTTGITRLDELLILAMTTCALRPKKVFEIGTFMGHTTSVFALNVPPESSVVSLDLPLDADVASSTSQYLDTDVELVKLRKVGSFLRELNLQHRYEQLYADSLDFDPSPHAGSVELGFIDGAHTLDYVENDTRKMATMMSGRGLVFWHDYGGRGDFRDLTTYLERLAAKIAIYRVPNTTLAWAPAPEIRKLAAIG